VWPAADGDWKPANSRLHHTLPSFSSRTLVVDPSVVGLVMSIWQLTAIAAATLVAARLVLLLLHGVRAWARNVMIARVFPHADDWSWIYGTYRKVSREMTIGATVQKDTHAASRGRLFALSSVMLELLISS